MLYKKQHILEARYFYEYLEKEDPSGVETNRLGYLLALRMMDPKVGDFEKKLIGARATQEQVYALQLHYYYTFSNVPKMKECAHALLNIEPTEDYTYRVILEAVVMLQDFELVSQFIQYLLPRLQPNDDLVRKLRGILNKKLLILLRARLRCLHFT